MDAGRRALLQGGLTHILEIDDLHRGGVVHPGCVVVPAVQALLDDKTDGKRALTAVLHGFEAMCRVGMAVGPAHYKIWHNTATCGPYGSAMAAASMLGLDDGQTMNALGNAGTQSAGLWQFLATGAMSKHLHAGRAAEAGVLAAELAREGFTGPPAILEGPQGFFAGACPDADPDAVLRDPSAPWQIHATSIKPWPSCRHTHPAIDAALALARQIEPKRIAQVEVVTYRAALDVCNRPQPANEYAAKFSLQHCVAYALSANKIDFDSFGESARALAAPLAREVKVRAGEPYASAYPAAWGGEVAVTLKDGARHVEIRPHAKGDPEAPLDANEMLEKATMLLRFAGIDAAPQARGFPVLEIGDPPRLTWRP
jgi:2-methylcitrate dehydratase PrpD